MIMENEKNLQRAQIRKIRNAMTADECAKKSRSITELFLGTDFYKSASTILFYLSAKNEADTFNAIKAALADGKKTAVPITDTKTNTLTLSYIDSLDCLKEGAFGILEPKLIIPCEDCDIDVAAVPGLVFDRNGGRIGYGKGYYDRLFCRLNAVKTALCYDFQLVERVCTEQHDVPMDFIITESEIVDCGKI